MRSVFLPRIWNSECKMKVLELRVAVFSIVAFGVVFLFGCSNTNEPKPPDIVDNVDTTTHQYSWEILEFGGDLPAYSAFADIYVLNDDDIWMVGNLMIDTVVKSIPHKYVTNIVNTVHWDGESFKAYQIESVIIGGRINTAAYFAVLGKNGAIQYLTDLGITERIEDTLKYHDLQELGTLLYQYPNAVTSKSGNQFLFGGNGFLAELIKDDISGSYGIKQIPVPTNIHVSSFVEVGHNDYYIACWSIESAENHFYHLQNGNIIDYKFAKDGIYSKDFFTEVWASDKYVYGVSIPYMFRQSIKDTTDKVFLDIFKDINVSAVGIPFCMEGRADNDIFIAGEQAAVIHYNGKSFHYYRDLSDRLKRCRLLNIALTQNHVYLVGRGEINGVTKALLIKGTKT